jgi:hypothetical protein
MTTDKRETREPIEFFIPLNRVLSNREILALTPNEISGLPDTQFKSLENRLRRSLKRQGYQLIKSRRPYPMSLKPQYMLVELDINWVVAQDYYITDVIQWAYEDDREN